MNKFLKAVALVGLGLSAAISAAQVNSFSDGSDGELTTSTTTIDLSQAANAAWNAPAPVMGQGVYDASKWAVVYKYKSVNITGGTVSFKRNRSNAPVIWLVQGDVTISGTVNVSGFNGRSDGGYADGGPGGFPGGRYSIGLDLANSGRGPGGGDRGGNTNPYRSGASYGTTGTGLLPGSVYGNERILPLIGGSGGAHFFAGAGGGGGAILIVAGGSVHIDGVINANGGSYASTGNGSEVGGSGGAIRIVANRIDGGGSLQASGQYQSGQGRIRLESKVQGLFTGGATPAASSSVPGADAVIFPDENAPVVRIASVGGRGIGPDPSGSITAPDVELNNPTDAEILVETLNVPATWKVRLRIVPEGGNTIYADAVLAQQNGQASVWRVVTTLPQLRFTIIAKAFMP